jgi:hypothetical protein
MKKPDLEKLKMVLADLVTSLKPVYEMINDLQALAYRTPDEEKELEKLILVVNEALPIISAAAEIFGNEAFINAITFYNEVKKYAENGDETAKKIVKELAPLYEQALLSQIGNN